MKDNGLYRLAGIMGLAACLIVFAEFPLWMIGGICPPFYDSQAFTAFVTKTSTLWLTRTLMDMVIYVLLVFFLAFFRKMAIDRRKDLEWLATLFFGVSLVYITITLVADSINGSIGLDAFYGNADPVILRTMVESTLLMLGSVGLILIGSMMILAGILILSSKILPGWLGWVAIVIAVLNYAFVPTMYFGTDPSIFYSASGFGASLMATFPFLIWIFITSIFMIGRNKTGNSRKRGVE